MVHHACKKGMKHAKELDDNVTPPLPKTSSQAHDVDTNHGSPLMPKGWSMLLNLEVKLTTSTQDKQPST